VVSKDRREQYPRVSEVSLPVATAFLQVFAELFALHAAGCTKARCFEGRSHGHVAVTALQPLFERWVRPNKMKRNAW
jgi:hypothetical protein